MAANFAKLPELLRRFATGEAGRSEQPLIHDAPRNVGFCSNCGSIAGSH